MARKLASALMVALMGAPPSITALGLGELDPDSALNEPLTARIPLLSMRDAEAEAVRVSLASQAAFEQAGLDRPFYLSQLKFEVKQADDGEHFILISSEKPIKEPFLDFLLEVRWPQGELQREYAILLDPPQYAAAEPSTAKNGRALAAGEQTGADPRPESSSAAAVQTPSVSRPSGSTRYGPVQANQTLWGIATEVRPPQGVTVYQTMQAIVRANPEAFIDGDINAMMKGVVLRVPPRNEIARIDARQAARHVREQLARWRENHRLETAEASPASTGAPTGDGGKDGAADAPSTSAPLDSSARLKVVAAGDEGGTASLADQSLAPTEQNIQRLQRELALAQERNANLSSAKERLQDQTSSLKEELVGLRSLVNLQLDEGVPLTAALVLADQQASSPPQAGTAGSAPKADGAQAGAEPAGDISKPAESVGAPADSSAKQPAKSSLKNRLLAYLPQGAVSLGVLLGALLLVLALVWAVRRRKALGGSSKASEGASGAAAAEPVGGREPTPILGHAAVEPALGSTVGESSPLEEAEAYIAHGRYNAAQERLDHALGEHPDNRELRVKLLEVLSAQGDRNGFEAEAQVLHTQVTDQNDPHWQRAVELARHIAPDHPLFGEAITRDTESVLPHSDEGDKVSVGEEATGTQPQTTEADFELTVSELAVNQSEDEEEELPPVYGRRESGALEFDLGEIEAFTSQRAQADGASASSRESADAGHDEWGTLDFSLPEDWAAPSDGVEEQRPGEPDVDDQDTLEFGEFTLEDDTGTDEPSEAASEDSMGLDEAGTKLDLARAYLDMGDTSGAKSLLSEVITEGNAAQQDEAQELLRQVG